MIPNVLRKPEVKFRYMLRQVLGQFGEPRRQF